MLKAYIEPSALNRAVDLNLAPGAIRDFLTQLGFETATGLHTVYELARSFLSETNATAQRGQKLFTLLRDLDPAYQQRIDLLLGSEVRNLRHGTEVQPFLDPEDRSLTREEVVRLAEGVFDFRARHFITNVEEHKNWELGEFEGASEQIVAFKKMSQVVRNLRTFDDVWGYFARGGDIPQLIVSILRGEASLAEAHEIATRASSFPAITAAARANVYLNFIMIAKSVPPGRDKLDDYKHCVEASYCKAFVTADGRQANVMGTICPKIQLIDANEWSANTGLNRKAPLRGAAG